MEHISLEIHYAYYALVEAVTDTDNAVVNFIISIYFCYVYFPFKSDADNGTTPSPTEGKIYFLTFILYRNIHA